MSEENPIGVQVTCPKCAEQFALDPFIDVFKDSRMSLSLKPQEGHYMEARAIGQSLASLAKLYTEVGKSMGCKTDTLIERIETGPDGTLTFHLLCARVKTLPKLKKEAAD